MDRYGFAAGDARIPPHGGAAQLDAVLDVLARVRLDAAAKLVLPAPPGECVLVTTHGAAEGYADVFVAERDA